MLIAGALLAFATLALAQSDQEVLDGVRTRVLETVDRLPRYVCTQTIDRSEFLATKRATHNCAALLDATTKPIRREHAFSDRLRLDVSLAGGKEMFSWAGAHHFHDRGLFDLVGGGPIANGSFGSFLAAIFRTDRPEIFFAGPSTWNGQTLHKFQYRVPVTRSNYAIGPPQVKRRTGYKGWFLVNSTNSDLVHLVVETDGPPAETGVCSAETTLDYHPVHIRHSTFLLPQETNLKIVDQDATEASIHTTYTGCHEFLGESTLNFGDTPSGSAGLPALRPDVRIAAYQPFVSVLTQDINTASAAAGDAVFLQTVTTIKNSSKETLVPAGSLLTGRLVRMQFSYAHSPALIMAIKLESVDTAGKPLSLTASATKIDGKRSPLSLLEKGNVAYIRVVYAKPGYVVNKGLRIEWITTPY